MNGEICHAHGLEDSVLLRYHFSTNWPIGSMHLNQNSNRCFIEISKLILKCVWKDKGSRRANFLFFFLQKDKIELFTLPDVDILKSVVHSLHSGTEVSIDT